MRAGTFQVSGGRQSHSAGGRDTFQETDGTIQHADGIFPGGGRDCPGGKSVRIRACKFGNYSLTSTTARGSFSAITISFNADIGTGWSWCLLCMSNLGSIAQSRLSQYKRISCPFAPRSTKFPKKPKSFGFIEPLAMPSNCDWVSCSNLLISSFTSASALRLTINAQRRAPIRPMMRGQQFRARHSAKENQGCTKRNHPGYDDASA